ncbi:MAG: DUF1592 domain-containing protein, partial [Myxococcota bacterium]
VVEQYMSAAETVAAAADAGALTGCDLTDRGCISEFIRAFGRRAYRRPLSDDERANYEALYDSFAVAGPEEGVRLVLQAMLQSPHFLYRPELVPPDRGEGEVVALDRFELATRLSYFLWTSTPDDILLDAAAAGELDTSAGIVAQANRMLGDPRAIDSMRSFHLQWLGVDELALKEKDAARFPEYTGELRELMALETTLYADHVIRRGDGTLTTLLTGSFTFLNGPLFELYGMERPADHAWSTPIALDPSQRAGILTHASVLAAHAHTQSSSPTLRGRLIRERLLCQPLQDPPPDVDNALPEIRPDATARERLEAHMSAPACRGCHQLTDPIGLGFETYDAVGRYRAEQNGVPVDSLAELTLTDVDGEYPDGLGIVRALGESDDVAACVANQWLEYALSRPGAEGDHCTETTLQQQLVETDDLRGLLRTIVTSDSFRYRRL